MASATDREHSNTAGNPLHPWYLSRFLPAFFVADAGPVKVNLRGESDYSGGTPLNVFNRGGIAANNEMTVTFGATGSDVGSLVSTYPIYGESSGVQTSGGSTGTDLPFVLPAGNNLLIEIDNQTSPAVTVNAGFSVTFYEVPE